MREIESMAASSSSSCKSTSSNHVKEGFANCGRPSEEAELCACDTFCHELQQSIVPRAQLCHSSAVIGECDVRSFVSAKKIHKSDREKLRRDRLNEQLLELAGALEPDRPKNDKSTILGDTIQALRDLMNEVERLRAEHASLADESKDLSQEKKELQDEESQLRSKVECLQCQVQQLMHAMPLWMNTADAAFMMGGGSFPYPITPLPHGATNHDAHSHPPLAPGQLQLPFVGPSQPNAHVQMPAMARSIAVHPGLQKHYGYGARGTPYFPYAVNFSNNGTPAEVPSAPTLQAQQSVSGYPSQIRRMQSLSLSVPYPPSYGSVLPYGSGFSYTPPSIPGIHYPYGVEITAGAALSSTCHAEQDQVPISPKPCNDECYADNSHVHTALQLQTPASWSNP